MSQVMESDAWFDEEEDVVSSSESSSDESDCEVKKRKQKKKSGGDKKRKQGSAVVEGSTSCHTLSYPVVDDAPRGVQTGNYFTQHPQQSANVPPAVLAWLQQMQQPVQTAPTAPPMYDQQALLQQLQMQLSQQLVLQQQQELYQQQLQQQQIEVAYQSGKPISIEYNVVVDYKCSEVKDRIVKKLSVKDLCKTIVPEVDFDAFFIKSCHVSNRCTVNGAFPLGVNITGMKRSALVHPPELDRLRYPMGIATHLFSFVVHPSDHHSDRRVRIDKEIDHEVCEKYLQEMFVDVEKMGGAHILETEDTKEKKKVLKKNSALYSYLLRIADLIQWKIQDNSADETVSISMKDFESLIAAAKNMKQRYGVIADDLCVDIYRADADGNFGGKIINNESTTGYKESIASEKTRRVSFVLDLEVIPYAKVTIPKYPVNNS